MGNSRIHAPTPGSDLVLHSFREDLSGQFSKPCLEHGTNDVNDDKNSQPSLSLVSH